MAGQYGYGKAGLFEGSGGSTLPGDGEVLYWGLADSKAHGSPNLVFNETLKTLTLGASGQFLAPNGTAAAPAYSFASDTDKGFYSGGSGVLLYAHNSIPYIALNWNNLQITSNGSMGFTDSTTSAASTVDAALFRDAAGILAQRNSTAAQTFNLYKTYTDSSNYERLSLTSDADSFNITSAAAGTGTVRPLSFITNGKEWQISTGGIFFPLTDNAYDIGGGSNRLRSLYWGTQALAPNGLVGTPSYTFANDTDSGMYLPTAGTLGFATGGAQVATLTYNALKLIRDDQTLQFGTSSDVILQRDTADTLAQRRSTNAQTFRLYNTYTDASNYERVDLKWSSNIFYIQGAQAGTGSARNWILDPSNLLYFRSGGNSGAILGSTGFMPETTASSTNTGFPLGTTGNYWKTLYVGGASAAVPIIAKLHASQTANALEVQKSDATVLAYVNPSGDIWGKGQGFATVAKSADYTVAAGDHVIRVDATAANRTITLPAAASHTGRIIHIKKTDSSANYVRIDGNAAELVEDAQTQDLLYQGENLMLQCDGTQWWVL